MGDSVRQVGAGSPGHVSNLVAELLPIEYIQWMHDGVLEAVVAAYKCRGGAFPQDD